MTSLPPPVAAAIERLTLLANGCEVSGLDHLPIVSRENAAALAADLRLLLSTLHSPPVAELLENLECVRRQKLSTELDTDDLENADFETGYDFCVEAVRNAVASYRRSVEGGEGGDEGWADEHGPSASEFLAAQPSTTPEWTEEQLRTATQTFINERHQMGINAPSWAEWSDADRECSVAAMRAALSTLPAPSPLPASPDEEGLRAVFQEGWSAGVFWADDHGDHTDFADAREEDADRFVATLRTPSKEQG